MKSPIQQRVHFIKEVSLPPLNFYPIATLRAMLNFVGKRVKKGSVIYIFKKIFLFSSMTC